MSELERALEWHKSGQFEKAEIGYREALDSDPNNGDAHNLLGMMLLQQGNLDAAESYLQKALELYPNNVQYLLNFASLLARGGRVGESCDAYLRAISVDDKNYEPHAHYGLFLAQQNRLEEAEPFLRRSVELNGNVSALWVNYGNVLRKLGKTDASIASFEEAKQLDPKNVIAVNCLGEAYAAKGMSSEAIAAFEASIVIDQSYAKAYGNLGIALHRSGRIGKAIDALNQAIALDSNDASFVGSMASVLRDASQGEDALRLFNKALELGANDASIVTKYLYSLNFVPGLDRDEVEKAHTLINQCFECFPKPSAQGVLQKKRLRVGFLSGDFAFHSVAFFLKPLYEMFDSEKFELFSYSEVASPDSYTESFQSLSDSWRVTCGMTAKAVAQEMRNDQLDVLIDLSGHTSGARLDVLAQAPAPVIVNWLGYPNRAGLETVDVRIVDTITDPVEHDTSGVGEQLVRMDGCFVCFDPGDDIPAIAPAPCIKNESITFGSFNNAAKLNTLVFKEWAAILSRVPKSELLLKSWQFEDSDVADFVLGEFESLGISKDRIRFSPRTQRYEDHLSFYNQVDIALDSFPYNGTTTTCEALWMGVPVVALCGDRHCSRVSASLLRHGGFSRFVAESLAEYVDIAVSLASDRDRLNEVRSSLRENIKVSQLGDRESFARRFESALLDSVESVSGSRAGGIEKLVNEGLELHRAGDLIGAAKLYEQVLKEDPDRGDVSHYIGVIHYTVGHYQTAANYLETAHAKIPDNAEILTHWGSSLQCLGRYGEAIRAHEKSLILDPTNSVTLNNFGNALTESGRSEEALLVFKKSLDAHPASAQTWSNYGIALKQAGKLLESEEAGLKSIELDPEFTGAYLNYGVTLVALGKPDLAANNFRAAISRQLGYASAHSNLIYSLQYSDTTTNEEIAEASRAFASALSGDGRFEPAPRGNKKLRIGFVSADLREHAVARFLLPLLRNRGDQDIWICLYSDCPKEDRYSKMLRELADDWRCVFGRSHAAVAAMVDQDCIDILIDLGGHSANNRLPLFDLKPAFVQATWLGFPGSTGLERIDFRIADLLALPECEAKLFPETPLYLENGYHCIEFECKPHVEKCSALRGAPFTLGSFNNLSKLSRSTLELWVGILESIPFSRLALKSYQLEDQAYCERLVGEINGMGIDRDRILILDPEPDYERHLAAYNQIDLCLDPFPYNGTTTTCEALYMGVPVITLLGDRSSGRVGASLLNEAGLGEFICESKDEYKDLAIELADDLDRLNSIRLGLRKQLEGTCLLDGRRFGKSFFGALENAFDIKKKQYMEERDDSKTNGEPDSDSIEWIEKVELSSGDIAAGSISYPVDCYELPNDLTGKRVLDASCIDGFWSRLALVRGAGSVTAVPAQGCFELLEDGSIALTRKNAFEASVDTLGADKAELLPLQVYNLDPTEIGQFDMILFHSNVNSIRHLMFALDALRSVCVGTISLSMTICGSDEGEADALPAIVIEKGPMWLPTSKGVESLLEHSGFTVERVKSVTFEDGQVVAIASARVSQ